MSEHFPEISKNNEDTSSYHDMYEKQTENFKVLYKKIYKAIYERAISLASDKKRYPLEGENPNVLLCGTASSETSRNFVNFVQEKNPNSMIEILDINQQPLSASQEKINNDSAINPTKVNFIKGNALEMPFQDNSVDLIETDFFLQFFSPEDKKLLIREWARILSENGVITTRDFLPDNISNNSISKAIDQIRTKIDERLNIVTHKTTVEEIKKLFEESGLQVDVVPMKLGHLNSSVVKHIIAYKENDSIKKN